MLPRSPSLAQNLVPAVWLAVAAAWVIVQAVALARAGRADRRGRRVFPVRRTTWRWSAIGSHLLGGPELLALWRDDHRDAPLPLDEWLGTGSWARGRGLAPFVALAVYACTVASVACLALWSWWWWAGMVAAPLAVWAFPATIRHTAGAWLT